MKLHEQLQRLDNYPFHMPGHKRNPAFGITGSEIDITEIDGFDNLHAPEGVLLETEERLKQIYKSKKSFMLVGGSTLGMLTAVFAVCREGDKILVARNCHKSVYNACLLRHLKIVYIEPEYDLVNGYYTTLHQETVTQALHLHPDARALVITSPTYEGRISNIRCEIPLIIDAAHGAHLGIGDFPAYPKGSIVVSSLHKTLPALTQCAVMNVYDEKYIPLAKRYLDIFETSSPSYVLMNSVSVCCDYVLSHTKQFREYYRALCTLREMDLHRLCIKYSDDISKLVISTENCNLTGTALAKQLREEYHIEAEMASLSYIVLMTSVADTAEAFEALKTALTEIDETLLSARETLIKKPPVVKSEITLDYPENTQAVPLSASAGRTSAEFVYAYPPDIPLLLPGERISQETVSYLLSLLNSGVNILSDSGLLPDSLLTKAD